MASYTDQILQSRPYVQQLPLEAMAQVGMYRQAKYEEGVQKIQAEIDRVAGFDMFKPQHRQYLQSKLNELGSKLKTVAAGDFSNFQLVNSVGGMATQIGKDPIVQNGVLSTQRIRKEQQNIQDAQKAGKSSPDNEDYFYSEQVNPWLKNNDLSAPFSGEYVEYKDVDAKLRDLTSKLKEDELGIENPYMRDEQGRTLYFYTDPKTRQTSVSLDPSKGEKKLDLDMLSVKVKGLPAQRILNNFYNSLDANDIRQLKINSWAHYRGAGPEKFIGTIKEAYENKKQMLSEEVVDLAVKIQDPKITGAAKEKLQARLAEVNDMIEKKTLDKEMADDLLELQNPRNLEDFKYKTYTQNHLTNLAKDLSYRSYIQERKANPAEQADLARKKFQFEQIQEANKNYWEKKKYELDVEKFGYQKLKDYSEREAKGYKVVPGAFKTGMEAPKLADLESDMMLAAEEYTTTQAKFAERLYPSSDPLYKNMTLDEKKKALDKLSSDYRKNPNMDLTPDQADYLEKERQASNNLTQIINGVTATRNFEENSKRDFINKNLKGASIKVGNVSYTGDDIVNFNSALKKFNVVGEETIDPATGATVPAQITFNKDAALSFYKSYQGGKFLPMINAYVKDKTPFAIMSSGDKDLVNFSKRVENISNVANADVSQKVSEFIAKNNPIYTVQRAAINIADPVKAATLDEFLTVKAAEAQDVGGLDVESAGKYNATTVAKNKGEKGTSYYIEKNKDGSANVVQLAADGTTQVIPATPSQVALYFPEVAVTSPFADLKDAIMFSPGRTTNAANQRFKPGSGSTGVNAKLSGYQLPQLKGSGFESKIRIDVEGSEDNIGDVMTDKYSVIMYVPDPETNTWKGGYISGGYVSEADVMTIINKVSPYNINQAIKTFK